MTFTVKKVTEQDKRDRAIRIDYMSGPVAINYMSGPVTINLREHIGHLRTFHTELGEALDEVEMAWPTQSPPPNADYA